MKNLLKFGVTSVVIEPDDLEFIRSRGLSCSKMLRNYIQGLKISDGKTIPELCCDKEKLAARLREALDFIDKEGNTNDFWEWAEDRRNKQKTLRNEFKADRNREETRTSSN